MDTPGWRRARSTVGEHGVPRYANGTPISPAQGAFAPPVLHQWSGLQASSASASQSVFGYGAHVYAPDRPSRAFGKGSGTFGSAACPHCQVECVLDTRDPAKCARHRHCNLLNPPVCCNCNKKVKGWLDYDLHACAQCRARPQKIAPKEKVVVVYKDRPKIVEKIVEKPVEVIKEVRVPGPEREVVKEVHLYSCHLRLCVNLATSTSRCA